MTSIDCTALAKESPQFAFAYAFVNEHDIVSRADSSYISSIIDLYRCRYGLATAATDGPIDPSTEIAQVGEKKADATVQTNRTWPLPPVTFQIVGDIVVLRSSMSTSTTADDDNSDATTLTTTYDAFEVPLEVFSQLLFCEVGVHKRRLYVERLSAITASTKASSTFSDAETLCPHGTYPRV